MRIPGRPEARQPFDHRLLLVPVVSGPRSREAAHLAARLAAGRRSKVILLRVLVVATELPLDAHLTEQTDESERLLEECARIVEAHGVKAEKRLVRARQAGRAIVEEASAGGVDVVILGAPRSSHRQIFGHTVHYVLKHSPARVMVAAGKKRWLPFDDGASQPAGETLGRILVPMKVGPIGQEMLTSAVKLAAGYGAKVEALYAILVPLEHALGAELPDEEERATGAIAEASLVGAQHGVAVEGSVVRTRSIGNAIVEHANTTGADLIVLGSAPRWRRQSRFFSPTVDYVLRRSPAEVLITAFPQAASNSDIATSRAVTLGWSS